MRPRLVFEAAAFPDSSSASDGRQSVAPLAGRKQRSPCLGQSRTLWTPKALRLPTRWHLLRSVLSRVSLFSQCHHPQTWPWRFRASAFSWLFVRALLDHFPKRLCKQACRCFQLIRCVQTSLTSSTMCTMSNCSASAFQVLCGLRQPTV